MKFSKVLFATAVIAATSGVARADYIAYDVTAGLVGNQSFGGAVGMDFNVTGGVWITMLGAFDSGGDGLASSHTVQLYDRGTQALVLSAVVPAGTGATLINGSRFVNINPTQLAPGQYTIVASGFSGGDTMYNTFFNATPPSTLDNGGGVIAFTGTGRYSTTPNVYPGTVDNRPQPNPYAAGTFGFSTVPEPGSALLLGLGAVGLAYRPLRRKLRRAV